MIIKIPKVEQSAVEHACAIADKKCTFYTCEEIADMLAVEIVNEDGSELSPVMAWCLARYSDAQAEIERFKSNLK